MTTGRRRCRRRPTWSGGDNTGDFSWNYPIRVPPALGGPGADDQPRHTPRPVWTAGWPSTNNQPSWLGEGFDCSPGSIERRYNALRRGHGSGAQQHGQDRRPVLGDGQRERCRCRGHAGELIKDGSDPNLWHLRNDDGTKVERLTGAPTATTTASGGWSPRPTARSTGSGNSVPAATLTVPVFGNHSGEPCHQTAFTDSDCTQAWRWNLGLRRGPHGNTMSLLVRQGDQPVRAQQHRHRRRRLRPGRLPDLDRVRHPDRWPRGSAPDAGALHRGRPVPGQLRHQRRHSSGRTCRGTRSAPPARATRAEQPDLLDHQAADHGHDPGVERRNLGLPRRRVVDVHPHVPRPGGQHTRRLWLARISHAGLRGHHHDPCRTSRSTASRWTTGSTRTTTSSRR